MSKGAVYPYGITLREGGRVDTFPAVKIECKSQAGERLSLFLIVDSGATISALPKSDARVLGVDVERGVPAAIGGIGAERVSGWQHEIPVRFGNRMMALPVVFLDREGAPRILGRAGVFERYLVVFEEKKRRSGFISEKTSEARMVGEVLDRLE